MSSISSASDSEFLRDDPSPVRMEEVDVSVPSDFEDEDDPPIPPEEEDIQSFKVASIEQKKVHLIFECHSYR